MTERRIPAIKKQMQEEGYHPPKPIDLQPGVEMLRVDIEEFLKMDTTHNIILCAQPVQRMDVGDESFEFVCYMLGEEEHRVPKEEFLRDEFVLGSASQNDVRYFAKIS